MQKAGERIFFITRSTAGVFNVRIAQKFTLRTRTGIFLGNPELELSKMVWFLNNGYSSAFSDLDH
jgi:hypothetical protein